ncbi:MAG: DNA polymerase III subunit gamma/tau [Chthoniobacterales bacterium]
MTAFLALFFAVSYQVFARKYRPQVFDDVLGQDHVIQTLKNAIVQNRLAHAYLFVGPRGTGKTSTARILAKALNCQYGPTVNPCGKCDSCREISQGISFDVLEIDGASNNSVDQIRELRENVRFAPVRGRYKIYIIDEVHMLTQQAFNALLKTLEEPPSHVIFVFATTEPNRVLPTILSRCQRFDLRRIPTRTIAKHLQFIAQQEGVTLTTAAMEAIAVAADGGLRDAESMLDQLVAFCGNQIGESEVLNVFGLTSERVVADLTRAVLFGRASEALSIIHQQSEAGKDLIKLLADLLGFLRNLLISKVDMDNLKEELGELTRDALEELRDKVGPEQLLRLIEELSAVEPTIKWTSNKKLQLEIGIIRAIQSLREVGLDRVLAALENLRSGKSPATEPQDNRSGPVRTAPAAPEPNLQTERSPVQADPPGAEESTATKPETPSSLEQLWPQVLAEVRNRRPLILSWIELATPLSLDGSTLTIGFPAENSLAMESVLRPGNRKFLEEVLSQLLGSSRTINCELRAQLRPRKAPPESKPPVDSSEEFRNDPLIQKALEIFRAEIQAEK